MKFVTIGVYGFSEAVFFEKLRAAGVDTFCDIRWRRGVRGREYAFANSVRLQQRLSEISIHYLHVRELAPSPSLRKRQQEADEAMGVPKRKRTALGEVFIAGYHERLCGFDSRKFIESLGSNTRVTALFCVERDPQACHRSILVERLQKDLPAEIEVVHLMPDS